MHAPRRRTFLLVAAAVALSVGVAALRPGSPAAASPEDAKTAPSPAVAPAPRTSVYDVRQSFGPAAVPEGAASVRLWAWMPEDRPGQEIVDFRITKAPAGTRIVRDPEYGRAWLHAEVSGDELKKGVPAIETAFTLRRTVLEGRADAARCGPITDEHRRTFARELRLDEKHMEVTPEIRKLADAVCGEETNVVLQARKIFHQVILMSDHYSKFGPTPKGKCLGDAMECMSGAGDCCTDQHALFIAMARARGIPCRLVFGSRLRGPNEGKDHDPGYRCWPLFFAPGLGWVPLDISSADVTDTAPERWFGGLDDERVEWAEGRDFALAPASAVKPDLVIRGWAEIDGVPQKDVRRNLHFTRRK